MFDLAHESFAKHGDSFFLEESGGVLIIPKALWEKEHGGIQKKRQFLFSQREKVLGEVVPQLQTPDSFSLRHDLPNEAVLLTEKTTVTLSNIEISSQLFFVLVEKTKVTIGENLSITEHTDNEDCIRESGMARNSPVWLRRNKRSEAVSSLALENIERMSPSSIGCVLKEVNLHNTGLGNILPKLRIHEDSEVEWLWVTADEKEHVAGILEQEKAFCVGRVRSMWLEGYAVSILPKMRISEDCEVEDLRVDAGRKEHVAVVLGQEKTFCVGRVKNVFLEDYAVSILPRLILHEDCEVERLGLYAREEEHVAVVLGQEKAFCVGGAKRVEFYEYAACVVAKLRIKEGSEVESLGLYASRKEHVAAVLGQENPFCAGRVKNMSLQGYAASVITKMRVKEGSITEGFVLDGEMKFFSRILEEGDRSIELGRIRRSGFRVPKEIRRKLRYTLVDEEGKEVLGENISIRKRERLLLVLLLVICFSYYHWL
ncbi:MAG: uncharacterized protein A8A55_2491 [Amphiamblys sp. WSBS2006]|nr:MAG: uncharacterized protein A8A55_2491 [Amphiamblys sp. WSBS2006]